MPVFRTQVFAAAGDAYVALSELQALFSEACNYIAPIVAQTGCWSRVGLHHLVYRDLRQRFPDLGSQMSCNAIYAVSKVAGLAYRTVGRTRRKSGALPRLEFSNTSPVFFDRHTLSIRRQQLSLYSPKGRVRIGIENIDVVLAALQHGSLKDILMTRAGGGFVLTFMCQEREFEDLQIFNVKVPELMSIGRAREAMSA